MYVHIYVYIYIYIYMSILLQNSQCRNKNARPKLPKHKCLINIAKKLPAQDSRASAHRGCVCEEWRSCVPCHPLRLVVLDESWHTYEWVITHTWVGHYTHMSESYHTYDGRVSRVSCYTHMGESLPTHQWVISHTWRSCVPCRLYVLYCWMSHGTRTNESYHTYEWVVA